MALVTSMTVVAAVTYPDTISAETGETTLTVFSNNPFGTTTTLEPGDYLFEVSGQYAYGFQGGLADAECSSMPPDTSYQRNRFLLLDPTNDRLDLYVNNSNVEWVATEADAFGCNSATHRYRLTHTQTSTGVVNFRIYDSGHNDNGGSLTVTITPLVETLVETVNVNSRAGGGVFSTTSLDPAKTYRFDARGQYNYVTGSGGLTTADAECAGAAGVAETTNTFGTVLTPFQDDDPLDVMVNGKFVTWRPNSSDPSGCDPLSQYELIHSPAQLGRVHFIVADNNHADNSGTIFVDIYEVAVPPAAAVASLPRVELAETIQVPANASNGVNGIVTAVEGEQLFLEVRGTYAYGAGDADAECANQLFFTSTPDPTFARDRFTSGATDVLDLAVNGVFVNWEPTVADANGCNSADHTYQTIFVPETTGRMNFRVVDGYYGDNAGSLQVKVFRIREVPITSVNVASNNPSGTNIVLAEGQRYRLAASGTYFYGVGLSEADAECSNRLDSVPDPIFRRTQDFTAYGLTPNDALLDLLVAGAAPDWKAENPDPQTCDPNHSFSHVVSPTSSGAVNLRVNDGGYADNSGSLTVEIFLLTG